MAVQFTSSTLALNIYFDTRQVGLQIGFMRQIARNKNMMILIPILDNTREQTSCLTRVAGLSLVRRVVLMAGRDGFINFAVVSKSADEDQHMADELADTHARYTRGHVLDMREGDEAVLVLAPDCLPERDFFHRLGEKQIQSDEVLLWDDRQAILLGAKSCAILPDAIRDASDFGQLMDILSESVATKQQPKPDDEHVGLPIHDAKTKKQAESILLSGLIKATEGWMALHINRKISLAVTRQLMHTSITPNHMTWISMMFGLVGAACFLFPSYAMQIWGALFFLLHSILDGCDGELARLKFMESRRGGIFDFWSDNIVHVAIFAAMGVDWAAASPDSFWPWLCAALAVGGTALSATLVYFHTMHAKKPGGPLYTSVSAAEDKSAVVRMADILSRRDFIYLVLLLALLGQTHWFLVMTAVGAPIYALLLIGIMMHE